LARGATETKVGGAEDKKGAGSVRPPHLSFRGREEDDEEEEGPKLAGAGPPTHSGGVGHPALAVMLGR